MKSFFLENGGPEKPVACPRCHSLNTKFCYFNNYNVKQPRHFCRECQRYWTEGGSLRNVPVGAGRRKHKMSSLNPTNVPTSSLCSDGNECAHISSFKPYTSLPFKHLAACSLDGKDVQELRPDDVMAVHGLEKLRFSQTMQKLATDADMDSKVSMATHDHKHDHKPVTLPLTSTHYDAGGTEKLGSPQMSQKRSRELTFVPKFYKMMHRHGPGAPKWTSTHDDSQENVHDDAQDDEHYDVDDDEQGDVHHDACSKGAPMLQPSHDGDVHKMRLSHCSVTYDMPTSCQMAEHDDSTCCSSVTTARASSSSEVASEPNGSSPVAHALPSVVAKPLGLENTSAFWGPLMWPWLWPFCLNGGNSVSAGGGISHVDPTLAAGLGAVETNALPQMDQAFTSTIKSTPTSNASQIDPTHAYVSSVGPGILHWPYVWNPLAWGSPWNMAWNGTSITSTGIKHLQGPAQEKRGSICIPKTLRMDRPDEAAHSSILSTLGVTSTPHSTARFFNAFQPRGDVFQPKTKAPQAHSEPHQHSSTHVNPAAQARSVAFQEGS